MIDNLVVGLLALVFGPIILTLILLLFALGMSVLLEVIFLLTGWDPFPKFRRTMEGFVRSCG